MAQLSSDFHYFLVFLLQQILSLTWMVATIFCLREAHRPRPQWQWYLRPIKTPSWISRVVYQPNINTKMLCVKKNFFHIFWSKNISGPKNFWSRILSPKRQWSQKNESENLLGQKTFGFNKFCVSKIFGSKRILVPKSFWVKKDFGSWKIWVKKHLGQKDFGAKKMFGPTNC